jgi:hypothetical protein
MVWLILSQPLSAKRAGIECCIGAGGGELEMESFSDSTELRLGDPTPDASALDGRVESQPSLLAVSFDSSMARCQMQYRA